MKRNICDVCGEDMTDEYLDWDGNIVRDDLGTSVIALEIKLNVPNKSGIRPVHHEICRVLETFGKTEFRICYVCWLKSLGVKKRKVK